ncbi:MAG: sigma-54-dependent transcriptional regulator, partial [Phycisphaerales bacterium JB039]
VLFRSAALEIVSRRRPDAVVTDLKMPGMTGVELLERIRAVDDDLPVVLMTAYAAVETAVEAMRLGAYDYVTKPFEGDELLISVKRAIQHARLARENAVLRARAGEAPAGAGRLPAGARFGLDRLIGDSPAMRRVKGQVSDVAESHGTVLIIGESGSGKEVVARAVHDLSPRAQGPFLAVNCAALSESLLESELFGHEKGAFTGADRLRRGRFELADGGTLLLDEVSEVGLSVQAKLLRVLQERAFERVGSSTTIGVDVRVVATSNRDLPAAVGAGQFRNDLFFRLNVLPIHLPPLRDREEDVPVLARHFIEQICARDGRPPMAIEDDALDLLQRYDWPGNVRELQNICERAVVLFGARGETVSRARIEPWLQGVPGRAAPAPAAQVLPSIDSPPAIVTRSLEPAYQNGNGHRDVGFAAPSGYTLEQIEREAIVQTLRRFGGHRQKTAKALGIGVRTIGLKLKKWKEAELVDAAL